MSNYIPESLFWSLDCIPSMYSKYTASEIAEDRRLFKKYTADLARTLNASKKRVSDLNLEDEQ